jgi:preprotein translocase subunit SecA
MSTAISIYPPATHDLHPERREHHPGTLDSAARMLVGGLVRTYLSRRSRVRGIARRVDRFGPTMARLSDLELRDVGRELSVVLRREGFRTQSVARAFALIREVAERTVGMRHFHTQLTGGWVLLKGMVAEMETGEGKTLTATLAAGTAALAGIPVHVVTVNDYLTGRDAESMGPIYRALGLSVGCITHDVGPEARRAAYECDITYCTNKEIAFDYLRDRIKLKDREHPLRLQAEYLHGNEARVRRLLLRGLHFAIIDEADSILIDEARTPLLISKSVGQEDEQRFLNQAMELAGCLEEGIDYRIDRASRKIELTDRGKHRITELARPLGPLWMGTIRREEVTRKALTALNLFHRDNHYLVSHGKVQIVDEFTGRVMPDRSWEQGLHQLIEIKEGCEVTRERQTIAQMSYQRFFRRYFRLAGMTGTAREMRKELWSVYGLPVMRIPTYRPMKRIGYSDQIFSSMDAKWHAVVERVHQLHEKGRPVLVGTRSVAASEHMSLLLGELGMEHQVLNAKQDKEEAAIIARAGESGCVTIATNMAGRGTDIRLGPGVIEKGGLHVILTERHEAARIDRQLAGRCGRLGDPGTYEAILSLEDPLLEGGRAGLLGMLARWALWFGSAVGTIPGKWAIRFAQKKMEYLHARMRRELLKLDKQRGDMLSFSGRPE